MASKADELGVTHNDYEANGNFDREWRDEKWGNETLASRAESVAKEEKDLNIRECLVHFRPGILWCLVISTCVIMEGYDTNLMGNFFAYRTPNVMALERLLTTMQLPSRGSMGSSLVYQMRVLLATN